MDTPFSWWADACVPGRRTRNLQVDGQQIREVTRLVGRRPPSSPPSSGLWSVWSTPWGCPRAVDKPAGTRW